MSAAPEGLNSFVDELDELLDLPPENAYARLRETGVTTAHFARALGKLAAAGQFDDALAELATEAGVDHAAIRAAAVPEWLPAVESCFGGGVSAVWRFATRQLTAQRFVNLLTATFPEECVAAGPKNVKKIAAGVSALAPLTGGQNISAGGALAILIEAGVFTRNAVVLAQTTTATSLEDAVHQVLTALRRSGLIPTSWKAEHAAELCRGILYELAESDDG